MVSVKELLQGNYQERFWSKVKKGNFCWNWTSALSRGGYGKFSVARSKWVEAHRISYFIEHGSIPNGKSVLHRCDNTKCVRPSHLFIGTQTDNIHDCISKGRARWGSNPYHGQDHPKSKLSNSVVLLIKNYRSQGWTLKEISELCNVSQSLISMIINGKRWNHLK